MANKSSKLLIGGIAVLGLLTLGKKKAKAKKAGAPEDEYPPPDQGPGPSPGPGPGPGPSPGPSPGPGPGPGPDEEPDTVPGSGSSGPWWPHSDRFPTEQSILEGFFALGYSLPSMGKSDAVWEFQHDYNQQANFWNSNIGSVIPAFLKVDGIMGKNTINALYNALVKMAPHIMSKGGYQSLAAAWHQIETSPGLS